MSTRRDAYESIVSFIRDAGPSTVGTLAVRLKSSGIYKPSGRAFHQWRATLSFARTKMIELERRGCLIRIPNPKSQQGELWDLTISERNKKERTE